jgi:ribosomal-protein-serine acetyltransferase
MEPAGEIVADRIVLRRWETAAADKLTEAVRAFLPELKPFMSWAHDDFGVDNARPFLQQSVHDWVDGKEYNYALLTHAGEIVGAAGLMTRMGPDVVEIGYWIHSAHAGQGLATEAVMALVQAATALDGIERIVIRHDVANRASARVAEKAGFRQREHRPSRLDPAPGMEGTEVVWERPRTD